MDAAVGMEHPFVEMFLDNAFHALIVVEMKRELGGHPSIVLQEVFEHDVVHMETWKCLMETKGYRTPVGFHLLLQGRIKRFEWCDGGRGANERQGNK